MNQSVNYPWPVFLEVQNKISGVNLIQTGIHNQFSAKGHERKHDMNLWVPDDDICRTDMMWHAHKKGARSLFLHLASTPLVRCQDKVSSVLFVAHMRAGSGGPLSMEQLNNSKELYYFQKDILGLITIRQKQSHATDAMHAYYRSVPCFCRQLLLTGFCHRYLDWIIIEES